MMGKIQYVQQLEGGEKSNKVTNILYQMSTIFQHTHFNIFVNKEFLFTLGILTASIAQ